MDKLNKLFMSKRNTFLLAVLFVIVGTFFLIFLIPTFINAHCVIFGHDIGYHLQRINGIADNFKAGNFISYIYPNIKNGYGYAGNIFYPDIFLYIPAVLTLLGVPIYISFVLFSMSVYCLFLIFTYRFALDIFKNKYNKKTYAGITTIFASLQTYLICDLISRAAIGELLGLTFGVLVLHGLYNLVKDDFSKPHLVLLGLLGVVYSHVISAVLFCVFIIAVALINFKKVFVKENIKKLTIIVALFLSISAFYLLPLVDYLISDTYLFSIPWITLKEASFTLIKAFISFNNFGIAVIVLMIFLRLLARKNSDNKKMLMLVDIEIALMFLHIFITSNLFPWQWFGALNFIQFPWRLTMFHIIPISLALTVLILEAVKNHEIFKVAMLNACVFFVFLTTILYTMGNMNFTMFYLNDSAVGAGEWLPVEYKAVGFCYIDANTDIYDNANNIISYQRAPNTVSFTFNLTGEEEYVVLPLNYYKGYVAVLNKDERLTVVKEERGYVKVITNNASGEVVVDFKGTETQHIAKYITLSAVVGVIGGAVIIKIKEKKDSGKKTAGK